jgi:hypothetical protein
MCRILLAITLAIGLALTSGCFRRSTEPVYSKAGASNSDRVKRMNEAVYRMTKGKSPPSKTDAGAAKGETGTSRVVK